MINFLSSWAEQVILAVIIATILELILPNSKNKKYVQMVIGVYVLFNIISPIIKNKEKLEINADNVYIVRNNSTGLTQLKDSNINQSFKDYLDYFINKTDFNENYSYFIVVELEKGNDYYYYTLKVK